MVAINAIYSMHYADLNHLNTAANVILILKKERAKNIGDYHPISLIHVFAKLITKILAL